jgi:uncharacterized protein
MRTLACVAGLLALLGCATHQRDYFYALDAQPPAPNSVQTSFKRQLEIQVSVPSVVDRSEMVVSTADGLTVLDHQRWAAPLADMIGSTLGADIERQRPDLVVLPRAVHQADIPLSKIYLNLDQVRAMPGQQISIEAHWRISDSSTGKVGVGREALVCPLQSPGYAAVAQGLSSCVGVLADRLITALAL